MVKDRLLIRKAICLFEQSGTFKNEFIKLGIQALDYDCCDNFKETDVLCDIFREIEKAYIDDRSIFDDFTSDDIIITFFPCTYFEAVQGVYYSLDSRNTERMSECEKIEVAIERIENRNKYHIRLYMLLHIAYKRGLRLIIENPGTEPSFLIGQKNFIKPTFIDRNRMVRGDYFIKPTAYWFININPTYGLTEQNDKKKQLIRNCSHRNNDKNRGIERSIISEDYARNFICDFILGRDQVYTQLNLFK